jgi:hypothetical protein
MRDAVACQGPLPTGGFPLMGWAPGVSCGKGKGKGRGRGSGGRQRRRQRRSLNHCREAREAQGGLERPKLEAQGGLERPKREAQGKMFFPLLAAQGRQAANAGNRLMPATGRKRN